MIFKKFLLLGILIVALMVCMSLAFMLGEYEITLSRCLEVLAVKILGANFDVSKMDVVIVFDVRLVRILTAAFVGFGLSVAGAVYQGCFKNPLVEPFILGASSGAAFGAAIAIVFSGLIFGVTFTAFIFSILAVFLSYILAKNGKNLPSVALVLSGIIVGAMFSSGVGIIKYMSEDAELREITFWMMGGLYHSSWGSLAQISSIVFCAFIILLMMSHRLNLLCLGENEARILGINPELNTIIFITIATLISAVCVANVGIIAWIGLIMPHVARLIIGPDNRWLLVFAGLFGAIYLLVCDTIARCLVLSEIPVGIITSLVGAPFLFALLRSKTKELLK
ncbi:FecCD family ABC transporter permease [Campylobacter majalis]|uniref:FecCD family ABC transporter permease n=1 Tax=Campylobacter majalis TaxID=2790656 RepID=UPI003D68CFC6